MRDVLPELLELWRSGRTAGVATVVRTIRSAPREPGAALVVAPDGAVTGSVSGGCVEAAVYDLALDAAGTGRPRLARYGVAEEFSESAPNGVLVGLPEEAGVDDLDFGDVFEVGLSCGGIIDVFAEAVSRTTFPDLEAVAEDVTAHRPIAVATVVAHPDPKRVGARLILGATRAHGSLGSTRADDAVADDARGLLAAGRSACLGYGPDGQRRGTGMEVFVAAHAPRPRMIVFGAIDFAAALARQGAFLGYRVTVCDARPVFATTARFPGADEVVVDWPDRYLRAQAAAGLLDARTAICVLTHDPKFDVPVLDVALRLPALGYVGVMGSRKTHAERLDRLRLRGLTDAQLARMASPIGLDLGARTPEETAVSIAAEIIATRWGGDGSPLSSGDGPIHRNVRSTAHTLG